MAATDHRRAVADRNRAAILDATERLLAQRTPLSMAAVASAAGVSRPTLYAHFKALADVLEAAVARSVAASMGAMEAARPGDGPADAALERLVEASWTHLAAYDALAIPVCDRGKRLIGAVTVDDVLDHVLPADWRRSARR